MILHSIIVKQYQIRKCLIKLLAYLYDQMDNMQLGYYQKSYIDLMLNMLKIMIVKKKKKSKLIKINTQFGHTFSTFNNLKSLLKDSGCLNEVSKILNKLVAIFQDLKLGYPKQLVLIRSNGFTLH